VRPDQVIAWIPAEYLPPASVPTRRPRASKMSMLTSESCVKDNSNVVPLELGFAETIRMAGAVPVSPLEPGVR
jgi:hypothetical protein